MNAPDRVCIRPDCGRSFTPAYAKHIACSEGCWTAILHAEIGSTAAGMRPFGLFGDRKKIQAVMRKYLKLARSQEAVG